MPAYRIRSTSLFDEDVAKAAGRDPVFAERIRRRVVKLGESPKHHGYHAGERLRCKWVAGVGNWAIIYEIDDSYRMVTLLRFVSLEDL